MTTTEAPPVWQGPTVSGDLATTFTRLAQEWKAETGYYSRSDQKAMHPAYQRIIGMGPVALPLILEDLSRETNFWFWALEAITGEDPVPPDIRGNIRASADAWVDWGRKHGLIR